MKKEAVFGLIYFALYMVYMFIRPENEALHWISLVALPLLLLYFWRRLKVEYPLKNVLSSVGISRGNLRTKILFAIIVGLALGVFQLFVSQYRAEVWEIVRSGKALYLLPLSFILMLFTAGFTEEFFFRGTIQTRLASLCRSNIWAIVITTILFIIYHIPYAYLNPHWPSYGNFFDAVVAASVNGALGGIVLGFVYVYAKKNLLAPIIVHAFINALPAMTIIKFGG